MSIFLKSFLKLPQSSSKYNVVVFLTNTMQDKQSHPSPNIYFCFHYFLVSLNNSVKLFLFIYRLH